MKTPAEIRERIESAKAELARAQGEQATLEKLATEQMAKVRELLGCKKGEEKAFLTKLRVQIEKDEAEVGELLDQAEAARDTEIQEETAVNVDN